LGGSSTEGLPAGPRVGSEKKTTRIRGGIKKVTPRALTSVNKAEPYETPRIGGNLAGEVAPSKLGKERLGESSVAFSTKMGLIIS